MGKKETDIFGIVAYLGGACIILTLIGLILDILGLPDLLVGVILGYGVKEILLVLNEKLN